MSFEEEIERESDVNLSRSGSFDTGYGGFG